MGKNSESVTEANVILDIHNTTANTGVFLLMSADDIFSHQLARYVQQKHTAGR